MAEALGIASALIAIIEFSAKIIDYAQAVKDTDTDQKKLIGELQLIKVIVERLSRRDIKAEWEKINPLVQPTKDMEALVKGLASKVPANGNAMGSRLRWPWQQKEIDATLKEIERYKTSIAILLGDHQIEVTQHGLSTLNVKLDSLAVTAGMDDSTQVKMLKWLSPLTFYATQANIFAKRTENTGTWLFESTEFKDWIAGNNNTLLATGIPGAGKSVLASTIVDYLQKTFKDEKTAVCYIYCNYKQQGEQSARNLVSSLVRQLATEHPLEHILNPIKTMQADAKAKESDPTLSEYSSLLATLLPKLNRVFVVIDALDECSGEERVKLVTEIKKLPASVIVMSREIPDILDLFPNISRISVRAASEDVDRYLNTEIEQNPSVLRLTRADPTLRPEIIHQITERSQGMFLLIHLHMKAVLRHQTANAIRNELKNLPNDDIETYDKAMRLISKQKPIAVAQLAIKVLTWIIYATRPLSLSELQHAVATKTDSQNQDLTDADCVSKETIISACIGLVIYEELGDRLRLVHYTTQEYFLHKGQSLLTDDPHAMLVVTCINHLMMPDTGKLYYYAARNWGTHARNTSSTGEALESIKGFLKQKPQVLLALERVDFYSYRGWVEADCTLFLVGAALGLTHILEAELKQNNNFERHKNRNGDRVLSLAAQNGHLHLVRLLLSRKGLSVGINGDVTPKGHQSRSHRVGKGLGSMARHGGSALSIGRFALLNHKNRSGMTALHCAAREGHTEIVFVLLQSGAKCNTTDEEGGTPLSVAARNGHEKIVELLLQSGAKYNTTDKGGDTPLSMAARNGHEKIVELLLQSGAKCNTTDKGGNTPLRRAARDGDEKIVELLLQSGAKCNTTDKGGHTPLSMAAWNGHEKIVELLLQSGAKCNTTDEDGDTPLSMAAWRGRDKIVELLLQSGAKCNTTNKGGNTPLSRAAGGGHDKIVELLLQSGAKCNTTDEYGDTIESGCWGRA